MIEIVSKEIILALQEGKLDNLQNDWNSLTNYLNLLSSYDEIECLPILAEAMFLYGDKNTNKNSDEERVRSLCTSYIIWLALESSLGFDQSKMSAILLLYFEKKFKYLLPLFHFTLSKEESNYPPSALPNVSDEKAQKLQRNFDSIKCYLHQLISPNIHLLDSKIADRIRKDREKNKGIFVKLQQSDVSDMGRNIIIQAFHRILEYGKHPLQSLTNLSTPFEKITRSLIKSKFVFYANSYHITERGHYSEGETQAIFLFDIVDVNLIVKIKGINEDYIRPTLSQHIDHCVVEKLKYHVDLHLAHRSSLGDGENVPHSIDIFIENNIVTEIRFFFIVGKEGWPRTIYFYGHSKFGLPNTNDLIERNATYAEHVYIPNESFKRIAISKNYIKYGVDCDCQGYLMEQLEANPKLLAWLFDDDTLIGKSYLALDCGRLEAFQQFYNSLGIDYD